ncbi:Chymotrypsin-like elastase family member 2A [Lamellibrachia satsuma]|nr:Chymotrypsin-like elastase family member 2A [Lamellibrachia satsuma]
MTVHILCRLVLVLVASCVSIRSTQGNIAGVFQGQREVLGAEAIKTAACNGGVGISSVNGTIASWYWSKDERVFVPTVCTWVIRAPQGKIIRLDNLKLPDNCGSYTFSVSEYRDYKGGLQTSTIYNRSVTFCAISGDYIDETTKDVIYSHTNGVVIQLNATAADWSEGFFNTLELTHTALDAHPGCYNDRPELLTTSGGYRTSPYLDMLKNKYINDAKCSWQIVAPKRHVVVLRWTRFWVGMTRYCSGDVVEVRDGDSKAKVAGQLCGHVNPPTFTSRTNKVHVSFTSDSKNDWGRFNFTWTFVRKGALRKRHPGCGRRYAILTGASGYFESPVVRGTFRYHNKVNCRWQIRAPRNKVIQLHLELFSLQNSTGCSKDAVYIYDNKWPNARFLHAKLCGDEPQGTYIVGRRNVVLVKMSSDSRGSSYGFRITYRIRSKVRCGRPANRPTVWPNPDTAASDGNRPTILKRVRRLVGGREAVPNSWPWEILLTAKGKLRCEAVLVHPRWLLTVASCVFIQWWLSYPPGVFKMVAGLHNTTDFDHRGQAIRVKQVIMHPQYSYFVTGKDIALLELESDFTLNDKVSPVCLPSRAITPKSTCIVTGWGTTMDTGSNTVLRQRTTKVISQKVCSRDDWWGSKADNSTLCVGEKGTGYQINCLGEAGAPLTCKDRGRWVLHGMSSFASGEEGCKEAKRPGVHTRVQVYTDWIEKTTKGDVIAPRRWTRNFNLY